MPLPHVVTAPDARRPFQFLSLLLALLSLGACATATLKTDEVPTLPGYALPPATDGILAEIANGITSEHGETKSGFKLLDGSKDGLTWRLALIDSATTSLEIQTYLWYPDNSGRLMLDRVVRAANRGVKVRLILDDLLTLGQDQLLADLQAQPNIEIRLFNPWKSRDTLSRLGEVVLEMERLNTRMHNKLQITDGVAAIVGGRNIGDHYFGLSEAYNFHDLDLLGFGHIATQASQQFDDFWNSEWVVTAAALSREPNIETTRAAAERIVQANRNAEALMSFSKLPQDWSGPLRELVPELHIGVSQLLYDEAEPEEIDQVMKDIMFDFFGSAQQELLITNAYIIPGQPAIDALSNLTARGVRVRVLTNSLESHDVPAVNSHYQEWRDDLILAGADLHELRADSAIASVVNVPPMKGEFVGLHTKAAVADRQRVFIGSMNLDPRSANINTEGGAFVFSPSLAEELAGVMERDMAPDSAWQVLLNEDGEPYWVNSDRTVETQPARTGGQRLMDAFFKLFPEEQY